MAFEAALAASALASSARAQSTEGGIAPPPAIDVTVAGETQSAPGSPRPRESRIVPGTFGDPLRAVETLPGVSATASGLPYFYVRGAPPGNSGYVIDGIPVPLLFHIGPGPSIVAPGLVARVDFFPGSPPARYGGTLGGVIAAETTEPSPARRLEFGVRTFDANVLAETPIDLDTNALVSGRYGYPNLLLRAIDSTVSLDYYDVAVRVSRRLSARDTVSVFAFGAEDHLRDTNQASELFGATTYRLDLRYDHRLDGGSMRVASTLGFDRTGQGLPGQPVSAQVDSIGPRLRVEYAKSFGHVALSAGVSASAEQAHYAYASEEGTTPGFSPHNDSKLAHYVDLTIRPSPRLEVAPGVRFEFYKIDTSTYGAVDPRLSARYRATDQLIWTAAASFTQQPPTFVVPAPGLAFDVTGGLQRAMQGSLGSELSLGSSFFLSITGFYSAIENATDYVSSCGLRDRCTLVERVSGKGYGVEILVKRPISKRLSGWIAYTLSRAERTFHGVDYLSPFDRTQVFSGVGSYNFGSGYRAGLRTTYYTGRPEVPTLQGPTGLKFAFRPGETRQVRLPDFYRIDARADKTWFIGKNGAFLTFVVEFFNATLNYEAYSWTCDLSGRCNARMVGPLALPSLGVEGAL